MCWNLFKKKEKEIIPNPSVDKSFQSKKLQQMQVVVEGRMYLDANKLCQFFGAESLCGLLSSHPCAEEVKSKLIAYHSENITKNDSSSTHRFSPLVDNMRTNVNFDDNTIHYAFDETILPFWKRETRKMEDGEYLYGLVDEFFRTLNQQ